MEFYFYHLLNRLFFLFHTIFILFNVFGWLVLKWRKLNLITLLLTAFSWFVLGFWYGFGYCFCADWHWQVRDILGLDTESSSYIHFLIFKATNINLQVDIVDKLTAIFFIPLGISIYLNIKSWIKKNNTS